MVPPLERSGRCKASCDRGSWEASDRRIGDPIIDDPLRTSMSKRNWKSTALSVPVLLLAGGAYAQAPQAADLTKNLTPVTDTMLRDPPAADWLLWWRRSNSL